jgi:hypothetical protein
MKPLTHTEVSDILGTIEDAQSNTRATLARFLRVQGYPVASLNSPSSHILERLTEARKAEDEMFRVIVYGDPDSHRQRDYAKLPHARERARESARRYHE